MTDGVPRDDGMPIGSVKRGMEGMGAPTGEGGVEMSEVFADNAVLMKRVHIVA